MTTLRRYANRTLWFSAIMLTAFVAGCNSDSNKSSTSPIIPTVTVTSTDPADTATSVPLNSKVVANFSEAMDATTIDSLSFTVVGASEPALTGTISIDANSNSATFTPGSNFTASTLYTATITTAATSVSGKSLAEDYVWSFTSGTTTDLDAPTVSSTDPANNATDFALNRSITAVFSETLDPASVNPDSFTLTAGSGATSVSGAVSYSNRLVTFNPASNLAASTLYTATLTTGVTDLAANALATNFVWTFETGTAIATGPKPVNLRTAGDFVILTKTGITNVHTSAITGNIGASPITAAAMDNVFCSEITGTIYGADNFYKGSGDVTCFAGAAPDNTLVANAVLDMGTAYTDAAGRTTPDFTELYAGDISGQTLVPGLYKWGTDVLINTDVTLSGNANDVWIFQIARDVIQASDTEVFLTGGAVAENVFWQVGGGTGVALDTGATFTGIVLAEKGITVNTRATVNGRLLSQTAVTLQQNIVKDPTAP